MTDPSPSTPDSDLRARVARALAPAYEVEAELGRGGAGIVYRATDIRLKRSVAVKILPPDLAFRPDVRDRFMREAETSAHLTHPHIVPIYSVDEKDGLAFFIMALVEGENLAERVRTAGPLELDDVRRILREVAEALAYAHGRGVVHRDIKPDNILLDSQSRRAMVTDFGIARAATESDTRLTATGTAIGTPAYMSPEQCSGDRDLDGRTDLYSLGAVAYFMISGHAPFDGPSTPVVMMKQVMEQPAPLSRFRAGIPEDLDRIVMRLLAKDPAHRFADGGSLVAALNGAPISPSDPQPARMDTLAAKPWFAFAPIPAPLAPWDLVGAKFESKQLRKDEKRMRKEARENARPLPDRIKSFRRHLASYVGTTTFLFGINAVTIGGDNVFWWAAFPALGMMMGLVNEGGSLWAAGARLRDVFGGSRSLPDQSPPPQALAAGAAQAIPSDDTNLIADISPGPRGDIARQAFADRRSVRDLVARMSKAEREMLPDVEETSDGLYQRIAELGRILHRLDGEIGPERLPEIDSRIAESERSEATSDRDRLLRLLRRQREMLAALVESRDKLAGQYESAGLLLQNLKLDLIRMRSSGLQSGLADVTSVTQEARTLSKEIGYVLAAADELRDIDARP